MKPGQWCVCKGDTPFSVEVLKIDTVTPRYVKNIHGRLALKTHVLAVFDTYPEAERLRSRVEGIRGEFNRRYTAARKWAENEMKGLFDD